MVKHIAELWSGKNTFVYKFYKSYNHMKKFNVSIRVLALTLLIGGLSSCSNRDNLLDENVTSEKEICFAGINEQRFSSNILSRAGESTPVSNLEKFFEDKLICMYVDKVNADGSVVPYYDRKYLTVENGKLVMPEKLYYPSDGSSVNIYVVAASPYSTANDANTAKPTFFNQYCTDWQTNSNSDLLYAKIAGVSSSTISPLSLQFKHLGTKISIAVTCQDNSKFKGLQLQKNKKEFTIKMADGTYNSTPDGENAYNEKVTMRYEDAINDSFDGYVSYASAYIAPQTMDRGTEFIKFTYNDKDYYYKLEDGYKFSSGIEYKFHITLKPVTRGASDIEVVCVNENF